MKIKNFLISWLPVFVAMFAINGFFHGKLAGKFFDEQLAPFQAMIHPAEYTDLFWVILLELILSFAMTYFILEPGAEKLSERKAAFKGGLINLVSSSAWSFANAATFFSWSVTLSLVDITWHVLLGAFGGYLIALLYNKFGDKNWQSNGIKNHHNE